MLGKLFAAITITLQSKEKPVMLPHDRADEGVCPYAKADVVKRCRWGLLPI